jgi:hypothetical protein
MEKREATGMDQLIAHQTYQNNNHNNEQLKTLVQKRHNPQFCTLLLKIKNTVLSSATVFLMVKLKFSQKCC